MTFNDYQNKAVATAIYGAGNTIIYPALGLANEAGEVLGKIKKVLRDNNGEFTEETNKAIGAEIGDVLWYMAALCRDLNIQLDDVANSNIEKLLKLENKDIKETKKDSSLFGLWSSQGI